MNFIGKKKDVTKERRGIFIIGVTFFLVIFSGTALADVLIGDFGYPNTSYVQPYPRSPIDGYSEDNWIDWLNDESHRGDNGRKPRFKWDKWGDLW